MQRAFGGSWTEYMHTDEGVHHMATYWSREMSIKSHRTCPFCKNWTGNPRHYVMACTETTQYTEAICDTVEVEIANICDQEQLLRKGKEFHTTKPPASLDEDATNANKLLILHARRWLARDTDMEKRFIELYEEDTIKANDMEDEFDMAYRAIVPAPPA